MGLWQPELNLKLTVKIVLLGFQDHDNLAVDSKALEETLEDVLPYYSVPVLTGEGQVSQAPLKVKYDLSYQVKHASEESHSKYMSTFADAAKVDTISGTDEHLLIDLDKVSGQVEQLAMKESGMSTARATSFGEREVTVLVASPNRRELHGKFAQRLGIRSLESAEDIPIRYSFAEAGSLHKVERKSAAGETKDGGTGDTGRRSTCARSWIGRGRVLVLDLGATACEYGARRETGTHDTVTEAVFPSVDVGGSAGDTSEHWLFRHRWSKNSRTPVDGEANVDVSPNLATLFNLKFSSLVVSAMRTILAPAVSASSAPGSDVPVIMIPVLVFRGQNNADNVRADDKGSTASSFVNDLEGIVDITKVSEAMSSMALPTQEIVVVGAVHTLSEHPQMAVALRKSLATRTRIHPREGRNGSPLKLEFAQEGYVDSARLLLEIKSAGDELASSLLLDLGTPDWNSRVRLDVDVALGTKGYPHGSNNQRVRVLPVFVFCLEDMDVSSGGDDRSGQDSSPAGGTDHTARLFGDSRPFSAEIGGDTVLVLQSEGSAPIPFFERNETLRLSSADSTQAVLAGLLQSLHGTTPPDHWWSPDQENPSTDLSWAHGFHPFAPFGFGSSTPGELFADIATRNAIATRAVATAQTLSTAANMLENFAQVAVLSDLVTGGFSGMEAMNKDWGQTLKMASESIGLSPHVVHHVVDAHDMVHAAVVEYEEELGASPGADVKVVLKRMEGLRDKANMLLREVKSAAAYGEEELQWCHCTTERVDNDAHLPWMLYVGVLLLLFYGLVRLVASARQALLQYASSVEAGTEHGTKAW